MCKAALIPVVVLTLAYPDGALARPLHPTAVAVPFVGCRSDGQQGPQGAPKHRSTPKVSASAAGSLAYYAAVGGPGVLAPRGWHCFGLYGSNGDSIVVTPEQHRSSDFFGKEWFATTGPAVELRYSFGGTSGRWAVAQGIARYFPQGRTFLRENFKGLDVGPLPSGPYPGDALLRRTGSLVRLRTPSRQAGEGTTGHLAPASEPIDGIVMLVANPDGPDLLKVNVRLPRRAPALASIILQQASPAAR
jgi:hypothetical protein